MIFGGIITGLHVLLIFLGLYRLWVYDLQVSQRAEQMQLFRCYRSILVDHIIGTGIWALLFLIIFGVGYILYRAGLKKLEKST